MTVTGESTLDCVARKSLFEEMTSGDMQRARGWDVFVKSTAHTKAQMHDQAW